MHQEKVLPTQVLRSSMNNRYRCMRSLSAASVPARLPRSTGVQHGRDKKTFARQAAAALRDAQP